MKENSQSFHHPLMINKPSHAYNNVTRNLQQSMPLANSNRPNPNIALQPEQNMITSKNKLVQPFRCRSKSQLNSEGIDQVVKKKQELLFAKWTKRKEYSHIKCAAELPVLDCFVLNKPTCRKSTTNNPYQRQDKKKQEVASSQSWRNKGINVEKHPTSGTALDQKLHTQSDQPVFLARFL